MIKQPQSSHETLRRRLLLGGTTALSATAVALLAGAPAWAATKTAARHDPSRDAAVLNTALALEYEGKEDPFVGVPKALDKMRSALAAEGMLTS